MVHGKQYCCYCCYVASVVSDSVRPHRQQPTRLPRPWDFPGKNTGVGCHFLLQCIKVKSESEVAQLCPTLSDPTDCGPPGSSIHGIFQARLLEWGAIGFSRKTVRSYPKIKNRTCIGSRKLTSNYIAKKSKILKTVYVFGFACVLQDLWFQCTDFLVWCSGLVPPLPLGS